MTRVVKVLQFIRLVISSLRMCILLNYRSSVPHKLGAELNGARMHMTVYRVAVLVLLWGIL